MQVLTTTLSELQDHAQAVCLSFVETFVLSRTDLTNLLREHPQASAPISKKIRMMNVTRSLLYELSLAQTGRPPHSWVPRSLANGYSLSNKQPDLDQKIDHLTAKVEAAVVVAEGKEPSSPWLGRFERRLASGESTLDVLPSSLGSYHPTGPPLPLGLVERPPAWLGPKLSAAQDPLAEPGHLHVVVERARANMPLGLALVPSGTGHLIVNDVAKGGLIRSSGANIIKGDRLMSINGTVVESLDGFVELLHGLPLGELVFEVLRPVDAPGTALVSRPVEAPGTALVEVAPSAEADAITGAVSGAALGSRQQEQQEQEEDHRRHHHEEQQQQLLLQQQQQQELKTTLQAMLKMQQGLQKQQRALFLSMQAQSQATLDLRASQRKIQEELALLADVLIVASEVRKATAGAVVGAGPPPEQLTQWHMERSYDAARSHLASHLDEQRQMV